MKDLSPAVSSQAVADLFDTDIDDGHSDFKFASLYTKSFINRGSGPRMDKFNKELELIKTNFQNAFGKERKMTEPWYQESGDTAFVYFGEFRMNEDVMLEYYSPKYKPSDENDYFVSINDNLGLFQHAHHRITRENSPIKNVVIDLSCNIGGHVDAAIYLANWISGEVDKNNDIVPNIHCINDASTGVTQEMAYGIDVNLDHRFDEDDYLLSNPDINVYVLTSGISFSCGNLVPCDVKGHERVKIIGRPTSGGGSLYVGSSLADTTGITISSPFRMMMKDANGKWICNDCGVEPDIPLDVSLFYKPTKVDGEDIFRGELINAIHKDRKK